MGVIKQGILGGFSGKVANVVGSSWKGIAVLKSLPLSVANPKTAGQVAQRGAMSSIVVASRLLLASLIQPYWNPFSQRMSGYNAFVKENIDTFLTAGFTTFADFFATRGSLLGITSTSDVADESLSTIVINWTDNSGTADALGADDVSAVVYNETQDTWLTNIGGAIREDETMSISDANMAVSDVLHIYLFVANAAISKVADSTYTTTTVAA
jgi:hypothetical protein